jgi:hypothetical protein
MATGFHANPQIQGTQGPGDTSDEQWRIAGVNCETKAISMADEIEIIIDETGEERRLGSWVDRDQGSALQAGLKVVETHGAPPESMVPWNMIYPNQQPREAKAEALKHRGLVCYAAKTLQGLRTGLAKGFVAIVAVHAGGAYQQLNSKGIAGVSAGRGNHATHVDDLVMIGGTEVYDQVNSWGLGYGQSGRSYLTKDHFAQTFGTHTFWLLASTEEAD